MTDQERKIVMLALAILTRRIPEAIVAGLAFGLLALFLGSMLLASPLEHDRPAAIFSIVVSTALFFCAGFAACLTEVRRA